MNCLASTSHFDVLAQLARDLSNQFRQTAGFADCQEGNTDVPFARGLRLVGASRASHRL
jgi:hypothetical protein